MRGCFGWWCPSCAFAATEILTHGCMHSQGHSHGHGHAHAHVHGHGHGHGYGQMCGHGHCSSPSHRYGQGLRNRQKSVSSRRGHGIPTITESQPGNSRGVVAYDAVFSHVGSRILCDANPRSRCEAVFVV
jgi:hypothetical protein